MRCDTARQLKNLSNNSIVSLYFSHSLSLCLSVSCHCHCLCLSLSLLLLFLSLCLCCCFVFVFLFISSCVRITHCVYLVTYCKLYCVICVCLCACACAWVVWESVRRFCFHHILARLRCSMRMCVSVSVALLTRLQ